ncbi:hypothetical protein [Kribbella sp. DT2]|uniref:hypothetical protein n=1 Tax=Kribbella sp. DT2 TaxID=3393427 RepID=UPI003CE893FD
MNSHWQITEHLGAVPALVSTAPAWNSSLAIALLAFAAAAAYVCMGRELAAELRDE